MCHHACLNRFFIQQELFGNIKKGVHLEQAKCMRHSAVGLKYQGLHSPKLFLVFVFPSHILTFPISRACWHRGFPSDLEKFSQTTFVFRKKPDRTENLSPLYQVHNTHLHLELISSGVRYRRSDINFLLFMARWVLQFWPLLKDTVLCSAGVGTLEGLCREGSGLMQGHQLLYPSS